MSKKIGAFLLDVFFPKRCLWCDEVWGFSAPKCSCENIADELRISDGIQVPEHLDRVWASFKYEPPVKTAIHRLKFQDANDLAEPLGGLLAETFFKCCKKEDYDMIIAVPLSDKSFRKRGYNQSYLLAKKLSKTVEIPVEKVLHKVMETPAQSSLNRKERLSNVEGAYEAEGKHVKGKRILLIDDVYTTGSTLNECAKALRLAGATMCDALVLSQAQFHI